jgi:hypothetical protein
LNPRIDEHNAKCGVIVETAPLPTGAQFLNVVESIFSGMSRAIIHNSNYRSVDDAKAAIDRYFQERNAGFLAHPQRAGKKSGEKSVRQQHSQFRATARTHGTGECVNGSLSGNLAMSGKPISAKCIMG